LVASLDLSVTAYRNIGTISKYSNYTNKYKHIKHIFDYVHTHTYLNNVKATGFWLRRNCCDKIQLWPAAHTSLSLQIRYRILPREDFEGHQKLRF